MTSKVQFIALTISATALSASFVGGRSNATVTPTPAAAVGNAAIGEKLFLQCRACHTVDRGGANTVGPNLAGIIGAKAATRAGYTYSPALKRANLSWDTATMDAWLTRPSKLVPGNKMGFAGMTNPQARAHIIAYLVTLKK